MPATKPLHENMAELLHALGGIPPDRVRLDPPPGTATKRDLLRFHERGRRLFELVDDTLVEKPMGRPEAYIAAKIIGLIEAFLIRNDIGYCTGADDLIQVRPKSIRGPDVSFTSWLRRPDGTVDSDPISRVIPDLAVEVLSPSNTRREMDRKRKDYFKGGVRLVWIIDPKTRTAEAHSAKDEMVLIDESGSIDGGDVLPGFTLPLAKLFERLEKPKSKKKR